MILPLLGEQEGKDKGNNQPTPKEDETDEINELQQDEMKEEENEGKDCEDEERKKPEEMNDEFPADLNLDGDDLSDQGNNHS